MNFRPVKLAIAFAAALAAAQPPSAAMAQSIGGSVTIGSERFSVTRYTVRRGDTANSIARSAGVPLAIILALNPRIDASRLRVGDVIIVPGRSAPVAQTSISVEPDRGPIDSEVEITGRGFRPDASINLLAGREPDDLEVYERLRSDRRGRVGIVVELPEWARPGREVYFALQMRGERGSAVVQPFRVSRRAARAERVAVTGTITRRGAECPIMRGDDGRNYALAGDLEGFGPGDRVNVEGRLAEVSTCMEGTTIDIRGISEAE